MKAFLRSVALLIALVLMVGCAGNPAPDATAEKKEQTATAEPKSDESTARESLDDEETLGIENPIRFAEDIRILDASEQLTEKRYEVPYRMDDAHIMLLYEPLAKGLLHASIYNTENKDGYGYSLTATGYYDLEKGKFVPIAEVGMPGYETADDVERLTLYPLDEGHILCEKFWGENLEYAVYTIADGSLRDFVTFGPNENYYYIDFPHTVPGKFTLAEPTPDGEGHTHVYDIATMKKILTHDGGESIFPWKDDVVYLERIHALDADDHFVDLYLEDRVYSWKSTMGEYLLTYGVGTDPDGVYALISTTAERPHDVDSDAIHPGGDDSAYFELYRMNDETRFFEMRGMSIDARIAGPWIAISRPTYLLSEEQKPVYLLVPGAHEALRITPEEQVSMIELLAYEPYAVIYPKADDKDRTVTVTTYAPREKAR